MPINFNLHVHVPYMPIALICKVNHSDIIITYIIMTILLYYYKHSVIVL